QLKMKTVFFQQRESAPEVRGIAEIGTRRALPNRVRIPIEHLAYAAQVRELLLRLDRGLGIRIGKIDIRDDAVRKSMLIRHRLEPACFLERLAGPPHRGHVHRFRYALRTDIVDELLGGIVAANSKIVSQQPAHWRGAETPHPT